MISAIVAVDENYGIGYRGKLLANIPDDMKRFKEMTLGKTIILGRKTFDSFLKPLYNRKHIVISDKYSGIEYYYDNGIKTTVQFEDMQSVKDYLDKKKDSNEEIFIIGGESIYKELLPYCQRIYMTKIFYLYDKADTYFPNINNVPEWTMTEAGEIKEYKGINYQFCTYERKEVEEVMPNEDEIIKNKETTEDTDKTTAFDNVNHPSHYTNSGMECIDEMVLVFGKEAVKHFCLLNVWKYRKRALYKNGKEDLDKSNWYMNKYKELSEEIY